MYTAKAIGHENILVWSIHDLLRSLNPATCTRMCKLIILCTYTFNSCVPQQDPVIKGAISLGWSWISQMLHLHVQEILLQRDTLDLPMTSTCMTLWLATFSRTVLTVHWEWGLPATTNKSVATSHSASPFQWCLLSGKCALGGRQWAHSPCKAY